MATPETSTPYDEALSLLQAGLSGEVVSQRLKARGLADGDVSLLFDAVRNRLGDSVSVPSSFESAPAVIVPAPTPTPAPAQATAVAVVSSTEPCARCGSFLRSGQWQKVLGRFYCTSCAARPDVNTPKFYRDSRWGKRDGWAWMFGVLGVLSFVVALGSLLGGNAYGVFALVVGAAYIAFWAGWKSARRLLVTLSIMSAALALLSRQPTGIMGIVLIAAAVNSPRNKLFFKIEVSEAELFKAWQAEHGNRAALWGRGFAIVALLSCLAWLESASFAVATIMFALLGTGCGVVGLARVNPNGTPPVGQRGAALFALIAGPVTGVAALVFLVVSRLTP